MTDLQFLTHVWQSVSDDCSLEELRGIYADISNRFEARKTQSRTVNFQLALAELQEMIDKKELDESLRYPFVF